MTVIDDPAAVIGPSHLYKGASDLYCLNPEADGMLIDQQITRQQLGALTGLSDDVLAFWIKNGLLIATSGGAGKGSHRRFDGFQVNIAAILAELRSFGINLAGLRSFAARLQAATSLGKSAECNPMAFFDAKEVWYKIDAFERGEEVMISPPPGVEPRIEYRAESLEEIYEYFRHWPGDLSDNFERILAFAKRLTQDDLSLLTLFLDIHADAYRHVYEGRLMPIGDGSWLAVRQSDESWLILNGPNGDTEPVKVGPDEYCSGLYLLPAAITRRAWKGRLSPTLIPAMPPSDEERAFREESRQRLKQSNRDHSVRVAERILRANGSPEPRATNVPSAQEA